MPRLDNFLTSKETKVRDSALDTGRIYMAEVMDTRNVDRAGDIKVWIINSDIPRDDHRRWITASYASPFFGTSPYESNTDINPTSFGAWFPIPFVGNRVFFFYPCVSGENVMPYWFSCPVNNMTNSMIPGIPSQFYGEEKTPLCELNDKLGKNDYTQRGATLCKREEGKGEYTPLKNALEKQGLTNDKLRGYSTAGSKREAPSMCYGILTPLGNSFTMDDGWSEIDPKQTWDMDKTNVELIGSDGYTPSQRDEVRNNAGFRFRTRNGTQLLISDNGTIYMINKDGTAWAEITDDGRLQGYAQTSADIACDGDINFKAGRKVIMEADEGFAFRSRKGGMSIQLAGDINLSAPHVQSDTIINAQEINTKIGNIESFQSKMAQANGVFAGTLQGTAYYATNSGVVPVAQKQPNVTEVKLPELKLESDKMIVGKDDAIQTTINTFAPTAEPYAGHNKNHTIPEMDVTPTPYNSGEEMLFESAYVTNQISPICPVPPDSSKDKTIPQIQLSEHFTLADLCYSDTAYRRGISNVPEDSEIEKLRALAENVLEPIWNNYGQRVIVNSGYRGRALNAIIGGATTSQHCKGEAADIEIAGVSNYELACWIRDNLDFDQVILEYAQNLAVDPNSGWVHVSYKNSGLRKQCLTINKNGTRAGLYE